MDIVNFASFQIGFICLYKMLTIMKQRMSARFRRWWTKPELREEIRQRFGAFSTIFMYFKLADEEEFYNFVGMNLTQFNDLYHLVYNRLVKRSRRRPLDPELRLADVLNFLVHGNSVRQSAWFFRIGRSTMYKIIPEVCQAIHFSLRDRYLKFPEHRNEWNNIINEFHNQYDFPNCVGVVDGKHFKLKAPANAGSMFYNFKKFQSMVLMAVCDASLKFIWASVGHLGSTNDATIFQTSNLANALNLNEIDFPENRQLPNTEVTCPYFFLADGGFALRPYLLVPYRKSRYMDVQKRIFNIRLSNARKIIERAFGIMCKKWKIFDHPLDFQLRTSEIIIMCCVCLHNYLIVSNDADNDENYDGDSTNNSHESENDEMQDAEESDNNDETDEDEDTEDDEVTDEDNDIQDHSDDDDIQEADENLGGVEIRDRLALYFISPSGNVPWQWQKF